MLLRQRESSHKSFRSPFFDVPYMVHSKWYIISSKNSKDVTEGTCMQFFKYEGLALCETWFQENDSRRAIHEKTRKIALKSDSFNQKLERKSYFFVTDVSEDTITIGVLSRDFQNLQKQLEE